MFGEGLGSDIASAIKYCSKIIHEVEDYLLWGIVQILLIFELIFKSFS
jgi:hypothetical protein